MLDLWGQSMRWRPMSYGKLHVPFEYAIFWLDEQTSDVWLTEGEVQEIGSVFEDI
jgi:hypothetical protein